MTEFRLQDIRKGHFSIINISTVIEELVNEVDRLRAENENLRNVIAMHQWATGDKS